MFKRAIPTITTELESISSLKKSFYCYACDATRQKFIDTQTKDIVYEQKFCRDLMSGYKNFIYWNNVIFM